jgi:predicted RNase H-like nuclease (RuvC/YqgF family)
MTSKETAAEQILAKHLGWDTFSGGSVMCNTSEILAAMKEYGASLQPKEADKDIEIEARERESKFLNERINEQYREIERLKAALDACFGVMMQFTSMGKGKFGVSVSLADILEARRRAEIMYYEAIKSPDSTPNK